MRRLVLLRPEPGASDSAARAEAMGMIVVREPLFAIEALPWRAPRPDDFDALLLTSANAVLHGGPEMARLRALPIHAVGTATADAARAAGLAVASVGTAGIDALLAGVPDGLRLLHLAGEDRRAHASVGARVRSIAVYRAAEVEPAAGFAERLQGAVVAVHSRRAGERLAGLITARRTVALVALSEPAAAGAGAGWERIVIAATPNDPALLASAAELCL